MKCKKTLRELSPRLRTSSGFETVEHNYTINGVQIMWKIFEAFDWLETKEADKALEKHKEQRVLISGNGIVGYGNTWNESYEMAIKNRVNPQGTVRVCTFSQPLR